MSLGETVSLYFALMPLGKLCIQAFSLPTLVLANRADRHSGFGKVTGHGKGKAVNSKPEENCSKNLYHSSVICSFKKYGWFYRNLHHYKQISCVVHLLSSKSMDEHYFTL